MVTSSPKVTIRDARVTSHEERMEPELPFMSKKKKEMREAYTGWGGVPGGKTQKPKMWPQTNKEAEKWGHSSFYPFLRKLALLLSWGWSGWVGDACLHPLVSLPDQYTRLTSLSRRASSDPTAASSAITLGRGLHQASPQRPLPTWDELWPL